MKLLKMRLLQVFILIAICFLTSCVEDNEEKCAFIPEAQVAIDLKMESLENALPAITSKAELVSFFSQHTTLRDYFFNRPAYPDDSVFINELYHRFTNPHFDTLLMETKKVFGDNAELKSEFGQAFANIKYYYPDFNPPKIITVITGLESDLYVSDSLIIVGLDYFLGPKPKYKPINLYEYMLRRYQKNFIVPSVMLLYGIDSRFNKTSVTDKTVLADMIAYGKAYYFAKHMMPCTPDSIFIAYTKDELSGSRKNEGLIWYRFIEDQVLYQSSHQVKQKYIDERPKTIEVGEKCPGRIGTWVGWQIVNTYAERYPETTLPQLMNAQNADKIFKDSKYKPDIPKTNISKGLKPGA